MAKFAARFHTEDHDRVIKEIFDHVRGFLYSATFLAAGSYSARYDDQALFGLIVSENLGMGILGVGVLLMLLNLYGGLRRLKKLQHPVLLSVLLTLIYVLTSVRIVEVMWSFREFKYLA